VRQREGQHAHPRKDLASNILQADARLQVVQAQQHEEEERIRAEEAKIHDLDAKLRDVHQQLARESDSKYEDALQKLHEREDAAKRVRDERILLEQHVTQEETKLIELRRRCAELQAKTQQGEAALARHTNEDELLRRRAEQSLKELHAEVSNVEARARAEELKLQDLNRTLADLRESDRETGEQTAALVAQMDEAYMHIAVKEAQLKGLDEACSERGRCIEEIQKRRAADRAANEAQSRLVDERGKLLAWQIQAASRKLEALEQQMKELEDEEGRSKSALNELDEQRMALSRNEQALSRKDEACILREKEVTILAEHVNAMRRKCSELQFLVKSVEERVRGQTNLVQLRARNVDDDHEALMASLAMEEARIEAEKSKLRMALSMVYGDPLRAPPTENFDNALGQHQAKVGYNRDYEFIVEGSAAVWKDITDIVSGGWSMPTLVWADRKGEPIPVAQPASEPLENVPIAAPAPAVKDQLQLERYRVHHDSESTYTHRTIHVERRVDIDSTLRLLRDDVIAQNDRIKSLMHDVRV
jgi:hypothetical protein